ncbi:hypothetical protein BDQ12DRAFT_161231 [Crucibulum laeve]|uniref:Uncharacterized protein n=1 Tax=Crucibulum laeve TaxID=68775 RepID=A0A5C3LX11_9AGAR|nr:hypothetical protein BDQ12DRAFT_161231 [Crucibulum laeve]
MDRHVCQHHGSGISVTRAHRHVRRQGLIFAPTSAKVRPPASLAYCTFYGPDIGRQARPTGTQNHEELPVLTPDVEYSYQTVRPSEGVCTHPTIDVGYT